MPAPTTQTTRSQRFSRGFSYSSGLIFPHKLHPGHLVDQIFMDILARRKRQVGEQVRHVTGIDRHSQKVLALARGEQMSPGEYCDTIAQQAKSTWKRLGIDYDRFVDTGSSKHRAVLSDLLERCRPNLRHEEFEEHYCGSCESPKRRFELLEQHCIDCGEIVQTSTRTHYTFDAAPYTDRVIELLERKRPPFLEPEALRLRVLKDVREKGLGRFSLSRPPSSWGTSFPFHEGIEPNSVVWIWLDSLAADLTGAGYLHEPDAFKFYWPQHKIGAGRDIVKYVGLLFPALLMSAGLPMPLGVAAHGLVQTRGERMSASRGIGLNQTEEALRWGADPLRWYIVRAFNPHGSDWEFESGGIKRFLDDELKKLFVDPLQSLVELLHQNFNGVISHPEPAFRPPMITFHLGKFHGAMNIEKTYSGVIALRDLFNQWYFYRQKKQKLRKLFETGEDERARRTFKSAFELARVLAVAAWPIIPETSEAMLRKLDIDDHPLSGKDTVSFDLQPHVMEGRRPRLDLSLLA